jgi:hypothetical protein
LKGWFWWLKGVGKLLGAKLHRKVPNNQAHRLLNGTLIFYLTAWILVVQYPRLPKSPIQYPDFVSFAPQNQQRGKYVLIFKGKLASRRLVFSANTRRHSFIVTI